MLGLRGEEGSEQECSQVHQGWNFVNKNLFPSTLFVESCVKAPCGQGPVCLVTIPESYIDVVHQNNDEYFQMADNRY